VRDDFKKKHGRRLLFSHKSKSSNSVSLSLCKEKTARCVGTDSGFKTRKKQQKKKKQMRVWFKDNKSTNHNNNAASHLKREGANKQTTDPPNTHKAQNTTTTTTTTTQQTKHNQAQQLKWDKTKQNKASHKTQTEEAGRRHMYVWVVVVVVVQQKREGERSA
jgi:cobalamin biosynthesis Mg chelatase CobN